MDFATKMRVADLLKDVRLRIHRDICYDPQLRDQSAAYVVQEAARDPHIVEIDKVLALIEKEA